MARAYSLDLRERVVGAVDAGQSCHEAAALFSMRASNAIKWNRRKRENGSPDSKPMGGRRPRLLEGEKDWILSRMTENPDLTVQALLDELHERGTIVSCDTLWHFLKRVGLSLKKSRSRRPEQDRPDIARRRHWWKKYQTRIDPSRLAFIDETWVKTNLARLCGWCRKGRALRAKLPHRHWAACGG